MTGPDRRGGVPRLSFFCELAPGPLARLFTDARVPILLRELEATVTLGLMDLSDERAGVVRMLMDEGIPLNAWILLSEEGGYWCHSGNGPEVCARYEEFRAWTERHALRWERVGIDIEPSIHDVRDARANPWTLLTRSVPRLFARIDDARATYEGLVAAIRRDGYPVDAYVFPFIHHERRAGTAVLQRLTGMLDVGVDREVCMLYTSFVRPYGPGLLDYYAAHFPAVAVGVTGGGVEEGLNPPPPLTWDEFARDLRIARGHTDDVHVFSLEGCVQRGWLARLTTVDWTAREPVPEFRARAEVLARRLELGLRVLERPGLAAGVAGVVAGLAVWGASRVWGKGRE
ncbi:MAG TPA: hypothetical protein VF665_19935 [Longimicrobium sp.]|jgi:hypothetical protein|uniref:hypothetical protein n=1 Tax=Longimicrobium sp. TaxID=2029185 RepID=UPI002ED90E97